MKDPEVEKLQNLYDQIKEWARHNNCSFVEALECLKLMLLHNTKKLRKPTNGGTQ